MPEPIIAAGVGASASVIGNTALARRIEDAMAAAVTAALEAGTSINDSDTIRAAMMRARADVLRAAGRPAEE